MADKTKIEWTGATWNPITGCSIKSCGCNNCYAMGLAATRLQHHPSRVGLTKQTKTGPVWTGEVRFNEQWLDQPLRWTKPRDIFVVAHGDLFHEAVPDEWIARVFNVMAKCPRHRFQVLTKRTDRMSKLMLGPKHHTEWSPALWHRSRLQNVLLGTSVERQQEADERRKPLAALAAGGWKTWVSYEPALGLVDWSGWEFIKWLVSGGESGPKARPAHPNWYREARDFCAANKISYFHKQNGVWLHESQADVDGRVGFYGENEKGGACFDWDDGSYSVHLPKSVTGALLDGRKWRQMPDAPDAR